MLAAAEAAIIRPVATDPVKEVYAVSVLYSMAAPTTDPGPMTRLKMSGGQPAA